MSHELTILACFGYLRKNKQDLGSVWGSREKGSKANAIGVTCTCMEGNQNIEQVHPVLPRRIARWSDWLWVSLTLLNFFFLFFLFRYGKPFENCLEGSLMILVDFLSTCLCTKILGKGVVWNILQECYLPSFSWFCIDFLKNKMSVENMDSSFSHILSEL